MSCLLQHHFLLAFFRQHFCYRPFIFIVACPLRSYEWTFSFWFGGLSRRSLASKVPFLAMSWVAIKTPPGAWSSIIVAGLGERPRPCPATPCAPFAPFREWFQLFVTRFNEACQFSMKCFGLLCCMPFFLDDFEFFQLALY